MIKKISLMASFLLMSMVSLAQVHVSDKASAHAFPIAANGECAPIYVSPKENLMMQKVAGMFANDVKLVTGMQTTTQERRERRKSNRIGYYW